MKKILAKYNDASDFILDTRGYFLIRVNYRSKTMDVGFCAPNDKIVMVITGKKPVDIYHTVAQKLPHLRPEHYAYLGRELEKAYYCIVSNLDYTQDEELHEMRPRKK